MRRLMMVAGLVALVVLAGAGWNRWRGVEVTALEVRLQPLEQWVVASGQVRHQSLARIGAEITGTVVARHVREGDRVQAGDPLVSLRRDELQAQFEQAETALAQLHNHLYPQAQETLREARLAWEQAEREAARRENLVRQGLLSAEQSEQARNLAQTRRAALGRAELAVNALRPGGEEERLLQQRLDSARAGLDKTLIGAPFSGRVQTRNVEPGDQVQPGRVLLELARDDGLEIVAAVDEKFIAPLALQQSAVVIADAWPAQEISARVSFIAPAVDETSGTLDVHLQVEDVQGLLRQGMTVSVSIATAQRARALVLSRDYLQQAGDRPVVYRLENGRIERRPVETGLQAGTRIEITGGLDDGDLVILPGDVPHGAPRLRISTLAGET